MGRRGGGGWYASAAAIGVVAFIAWGCDATYQGSADATTTMDPDATSDATTSESSPGDGASIPDAAVTMDAGPDSAGAADANVCITDLSGIGTANFRVSFKVQTTATTLTTLVYQRALCKHAEFWDIHVSPGGKIGAETDNSGAPYTVMSSTRSINDGAVHAIVVARVSRILTITIDGVVDSSASSLANFGVLPPLGSVSGNPCEGVGLQAALAGSLTDLCVAGP